MTRTSALLLWLACITAQLGGQDLSGTWHYQSPTGEAITLRLRQDSSGAATGTLMTATRTLTVSGVVEAGVLRGTAQHAGVIEHIEARLLGESLLWRLGPADGEEYAFQRVEGTRFPGDSGAADPFSGIWLGQGVRLVLEVNDGSYVGTLTVAGETWSVLGRVNGSVLVCTVAAGGEVGRLTATRSGRSLMLAGRAASATLERVSPDSSRFR